LKENVNRQQMRVIILLFSSEVKAICLEMDNPGYLEKIGVRAYDGTVFP